MRSYVRYWAKADISSFTHHSNLDDRKFTKYVNCDQLA